MSESQLTFNGKTFSTRSDRASQNAKWVLHTKGQLPDSDKLIMEDQFGYRYARIVLANFEVNELQTAWLFVKI